MMFWRALGRFGLGMLACVAFVVIFGSLLLISAVVYVCKGLCLRRGWHKFQIVREVVLESAGGSAGDGYDRTKQCVACGRIREEYQASVL
ncbi:hypothetical protein HY635_02125 [Candidatus Uhrbacteria bacterium]|nr:hypothetical protein [Candidatus Uhrbacteria bacterium]